ncbi:MAG: TetR/AcrR family transcriptional regulator [Eubacteriaceae bacterium]
MDLRVQKTREAIKKAFKEMVCQMDAQKITVKELTERARIHRKTFYLHYTSIEALFEDMLQEAANLYFSEIDQIPPTMPMMEINRVFFTYLAKQDAFTERLISAESYRTFGNKLFMTALKHNRQRFNPYAHLPEEEQNIVNTFTSQSSLDMYRQWVADGKKIPLERLIELTGMLLNYGVDSILEKTNER